MFPKNATAYTVEPDTLTALTEERLEAYAYQPCTGQQSLTIGFSKVQGVFAYRYMGFILLNLTVQKKSVPASAVKARVQEVVAEMEKANGHKPGRKATKEVKERVIDELIVRAIPTTKTHAIFIEQATGKLIIDSASGPIITAVASLIYQAAEANLQGVSLPGSTAMTKWLAEQDLEGLPPELTADDFVIFEHPGEGGKTVKYERSDLGDDDVLANIAAGATVQALALTYDSKISFVLKDGALGKIKVDGVLNEKHTGPKEDEFQNAFYLAAAEMFELTTFLNEAA